MAPAGLAGVIETTLGCVCNAFQPPPANRAELQQQVLQVLKLAGRAPRHKLIHVSVVSFTPPSSAYLNLHPAYNALPPRHLLCVSFAGMLADQITLSLSVCRQRTSKLWLRMSKSSRQSGWCMPSSSAQSRQPVAVKLGGSPGSSTRACQYCLLHSCCLPRLTGRQLSGRGCRPTRAARSRHGGCRRMHWKQPRGTTAGCLSLQGQCWLKVSTWLLCWHHFGRRAPHCA